MSTEILFPATTSDTLEGMDTTAAPAPARRRGLYGRLWARLPQELLFLFLTMPIAIAGLVIVAPLFFSGLGMIPIVIGIFIAVGSLYVSRAFGSTEMARLEWAGRPRIPRASWSPRGRRGGFWRSVFAPIIDGHYWLNLVHTLFVNPIVSVITWSITIAWFSTAFGGLTYWIWSRYLTDGDKNVWLSDVVLEWAFPGIPLSGDHLTRENIFLFVVGVVFALVLPFITRGLVSLHNVIAREMLGAWRSEALQREVATLSASRGAAVAAEDASLRRLERDIHDGPQQRLVRLQMDLASAERRLGDDPEAARRLLTEARDQARDTLEELRALSRGFAPPILHDRGLVAGLESLVARSTVPVIAEIEFGPETRLPPEIERSAYFIVAELLTNASKHSGATALRLRASLRDDPTGGPRWLDLWVTDNGRGGAAMTPSHGLAGLDERLRGLRGMLVIDSPAGGPTSIGAHIPVESPAGAVPVSWEA
ncbi:sensor histidine kinase [Compostimonas suwonensis]|uniref:histidine kinase n=1 Tax=Compostimonas suwonensis TaxID=1048394 RepID=A0A2M9BZI9_9MICO|nr:sensor histidine kinase [Compostimonas suwonensis]PJJ63486.1 signal transduction histidine kinase [Compostimonas suwonensis]